MSYSERDARGQLAAELGRAVDHLSHALGTLGEAYDWLDEQSADRLEQELFRPLGAASGRAQRELSGFVARYGLSAPEASYMSSTGTRPGDARGAIERVAAEIEQADATVATLQDSLLPVEVGDPQLREGLAAVREMISSLPRRARQLLRVLGR